MRAVVGKSSSQDHPRDKILEAWWKRDLVEEGRIIRLPDQGRSAFLFGQRMPSTEPSMSMLSPGSPPSRDDTALDIPTAVAAYRL